MNFLTKTIANKALFSSSSFKKCPLLLQTLTSLQPRFASTTTPRKSKTAKKTQEISSNYTLTPPRIEVEQKELTSWPRPSEIPFQAKVANSINLVGFVQTPIHFETSQDGNYFAGTVVLHENDDHGVVKNNVLMIPVVFFGDLAHVVACHVKQNDCVYVSGKFSIDPLPYEILDEYQGSFHIVAENVNFVQGVKRIAGRENLVYPKIKSFELDDGSGKEVVDEVMVKEECDDSVSLGRSVSEGGYDWRDLVKNPKEWWDCRKAKLDGVVKARFPDFKKKDGSTSLWLDNAPRWILEGLGGLEFDAYPVKPKGEGKDVDSWKDLLENPDKWWDNRAGKLNQKAPDFKHKNTGIGLWVGSAPEWVVSRLPPSRDQQAASSTPL